MDARAVRRGVCSPDLTVLSWRRLVRFACAGFSLPLGRPVDGVEDRPPVLDGIGALELTAVDDEGVKDHALDWNPEQAGGGWILRGRLHATSGPCAVEEKPKRDDGGDNGEGALAEGYLADIAAKSCDIKRAEELSWSAIRKDRCTRIAHLNLAIIAAEQTRWAEAENAVRVVVLTSTRARAEGPPDELSDYDVIVTLEDIDRFDAAEAYRTPAARWGDEHDVHGTTTFFRGVVYDDGVKIDWTLWPAEVPGLVAEHGLTDGLDAGYRVLIDKDGAARCQ